MTLKLRSASKRFPGVLAVDDASFSASAGEITCYLVTPIGEQADIDG